MAKEIRAVASPQKRLLKLSSSIRNRGRYLWSHIEELKDAIHKLHGAKATHRESVPVKEVFNGETVWDGIVEVFHWKATPKAIQPMPGSMIRGGTRPNQPSTVTVAPRSACGIPFNRP